MDLPPLHTVLMPKLPFVDLQNTLPTVMVFCIGFFLIKELTSQQMKCSNGPMLMEFTSLTMIPTILKQLTWQNNGMAIKISDIVKKQKPPFTDGNISVTVTMEMFASFLKLSIHLPYNQVISLLDTYPKEIKTFVYSKTFPWIFKASLFMIVKKWMNWWMNKSNGLSAYKEILYKGIGIKIPIYCMYKSICKMSIKGKSIYRTVYLKWANFMVYKSCLNKVVLIKYALQH